MTLKDVAEETGMSFSTVNNYCQFIYGIGSPRGLSRDQLTYLVNLLAFIAKNYPQRGGAPMDEKVRAYEKASMTMTKKLTAAVESSMKNAPVNPDMAKEIVETLEGHGMIKPQHGHNCPYITKLLTEKDSEILRLRRKVEEINLENSSLMQESKKVMEFMAALKNFKM
jgi:predicted transcriptional regulator